MDAPSLEAFNARLDGTVNTLLWGGGVPAYSRGLGRDGLPTQATLISAAAAQYPKEGYVSVSPSAGDVLA